MVLVIYQPQEAITSDELLSQSCRIMIPKHLMRSLPSCVVIQRQKNMSWPGSRYYPSLVWRSIQASEKFSVTVRKSSSPQRNTKSFYCLQPTRGMYLHTAKSTRRCGEIFPLEVRAILGLSKILCIRYFQVKNRTKFYGAEAALSAVALSIT